MEPEKLIVRIDRQGNVTVAVEQVKGADCLGLTAGLEQALGSQVEQRDYTGEYYEAAGEQERDYA